MKLGNRIKQAVRRIPRLPRKWRIVRNLACALLLAAVFIIPQLNLYPVTVNAAFERECQANLFGEPEIIWQNDVGTDGEGQRVFLIADDGERYFYGVFQNYGLRGWNGDMIPWEKEGDITLMPFEILRNYSPDNIVLNLVVLHNVEGALRAEVDIPLALEVHYGYDGEEAYAEINETYTVALTQDLTPGIGSVLRGFLLPRVPTSTDPRLGIGGAAERAAEVGAMERLTWGGNEFLITVRIYGSNGTLLREETLNYSFPQW